MPLSAGTVLVTGIVTYFNLLVMQPTASYRLPQRIWDGDKTHVRNQVVFPSVWNAHCEALKMIF